MNINLEESESLTITTPLGVININWFPTGGSEEEDLRIGISPRLEATCEITADNSTSKLFPDMPITMIKLAKIMNPTTKRESN